MPNKFYIVISKSTWRSKFTLFTEEQGRVIRFYPGGNLMDFLHLVHKADSNSHPTNTHHSRLAVQWLTVTNKTSLFTVLSGMYWNLPLSSTTWVHICFYVHTHDLRQMTVTLCVFPDATVGMLLIQVTSDRIQPRKPLVKASGVDLEFFTLQVCY